MKPYEWGHPQFDAANHREYFEFEEREPYVKNGLRFRPADVVTKRFRIDFTMEA